MSLEVKVLPAQDLQQLSNSVVMFRLIYEPGDQHRHAGKTGFAALSRKLA